LHGAYATASRNRHPTLATGCASGRPPVFLGAARNHRTTGRRNGGEGAIRSIFPRYLSRGLRRALRSRPVNHCSGDFRFSIFFPRTQPVKIRRRPLKGFRFRPHALRRTVLEVLRQRDRLSAAELAGIAFTAGRPIIRPGYRSPTESEVSSTRRALRGLVAAGKVKKCGRVRRSSRQRSRNIYAPTPTT
jgi:hypothetical protein